MPYKNTTTGRLKNGAAQYNSWMQLTQSQADAIAGIEGADLLAGDENTTPNTERFAQVVYVANGGVAPSESSPLDNIYTQTIGGYDTASYQNIDGSAASASTTVFAEETPVRIKSYSNDNWIKIEETSATAVADTGMLLEVGEEISCIIPAGYVVATIGGMLNITPIII